MKVFGKAGSGLLAACVVAGRLSAQSPVEPNSSGAAVAVGIDRIAIDATALRPLMTTPLAKLFLDASGSLPHVQPRTVYVNPATREWLTVEAAAALPEGVRSSLSERVFDETFYFNTKYGSPLVYARAIEVIGSSKLGPASESFVQKRVLDYGYGTIGHLKMMAALGAAMVGVDVDPMLAVLYGFPGDQGSVEPSLAQSEPRRSGSVTLVNGRFPDGAGVLRAVGGEYDLILSKNTLKNGYLHPAKPVDKRMLVDLGTSEERFVKAMFEALKPGGLVLIYNICPAPSKDGESYKPWSDGTSPFTREQWAAAGFEVVAFDADDSEAVRRMWPLLGYDEGNPNFGEDVFVWYTLARRPVVHDGAK